MSWHILAGAVAVVATLGINWLQRYFDRPRLR